MTNYAHLAQKLFNVPLAITPQKAEIVMAALADRFGLARLFHADGKVVALDNWDGDIGEPAEARAYEVVAGIAVIPVTGTLVQKLGTLRPYSGMTGYDGLRACLSMALADDDVRGIALDIDSPGGEVGGASTWPTTSTALAGANRSGPSSPNRLTRRRMLWPAPVTASWSRVRAVPAVWA